MWIDTWLCWVTTHWSLSCCNAICVYNDVEAAVKDAAALAITTSAAVYAVIIAIAALEFTLSSVDILFQYYN